MLAGASLEPEASSSTIFSLNSSNQTRQITQRASQWCIDVLTCLVSVESRAPLRVLPLRVVVVKYVRVVTLEEPVDYRGTTVGTKASVLHCLFCRF